MVMKKRIAIAFVLVLSLATAGFLMADEYQQHRERQRQADAAVGAQY
jgi:hypothetical protein